MKLRVFMLHCYLCYLLFSRVAFAAGFSSFCGDVLCCFCYVYERFLSCCRSFCSLFFVVTFF
jgi:hypothetical protein